MKVKFNQFKTKSTQSSDSKGSNSMKKNRKLTALLVAACMTLPMAATTFTVPMVASGATVTIKGDNNVSGQAMYYGYKIFDGYFSNGQFAVTDWGNNINVENFIRALQADTTFGEDENNLFHGINQEKTPQTAMDVANKMDNIDGNSAKAEAFARIAVANVNAGNATGQHDNNYTKAELKGNSNGGSNVLMLENGNESVTPGYYVIFEAYAPNAVNGYQVRTLGLLRVAGDEDIEVETKRSAPTIKKEVENAGDWGEVADACIGDAINFKITGTLPSRLDDYAAYYYLITDTLESGKFTQPESVVVKIGNTIITQNDENCRIETSNNGLTVSFEDIKRYVTDGSGNIDPTKTVEVTYVSRLSSGATIGETGQTNDVVLTYSSNPNSTYSPDLTNGVEDFPTTDATGETDKKDTDQTVDEKVKVLTYQLKISKVNAQNRTEGLDGATFKLKRAKKDDPSNYEYATFNNNVLTGWNQIGDSLISATVEETKGIINIIGLDEGTYYLEEIAAPAGYNVLPEDLTVVITANTQDNTSDPINNDAENLTVQVNEGTAVEGLEANDNYTGILQIQVANNKGATLPSTGGIGTKIFYILGGTLVIGSGAALVIKKRMSKDEE